MKDSPIHINFVIAGDKHILYVAVYKANRRPTVGVVVVAKLIGVYSFRLSSSIILMNAAFAKEDYPGRPRHGIERASESPSRLRRICSGKGAHYPRVT